MLSKASCSPKCAATGECVWALQNIHLLTFHSFGAVLEEFEVRDALMNALAGRTNGSYMIGA